MICRFVLFSTNLRNSLWNCVYIQNRYVSECLREAWIGYFPFPCGHRHWAQWVVQLKINRNQLAIGVCLCVNLFSIHSCLQLFKGSLEFSNKVMLSVWVPVPNCTLKIKDKKSDWRQGVKYFQGCTSVGAGFSVQAEATPKSSDSWSNSCYSCLNLNKIWCHWHKA